MSSASMPSHGFVTVRGRGYRPDQVDAYLEALSEDRDAAWERAARLTVLAKDMEAELGRMREAVAQLEPQTYESLGAAARRLFRLVLEEAADLRERTRRAGEELLAQADEDARRWLLAAQAEADEIRVAARQEVKAWRAERLAALREARERAAGLLAEEARELAVLWAEA
ncbi:DivIVA domain-containing protein, partial [Streptomyces tricolor]